MAQDARLQGVAVAGAGMVRFGQHRDKSVYDLARDAGLTALHDAGITLADVDEAFVGYVQPTSMIGIKAMKELGLTGLPVTHVENASATGLVAFREAAFAVHSGRAEVAMAIGFDKMSEMGRSRGPSRGTGRDDLDAVILPAAYFALWAQRRMHDHGTKPEHFAAIAAKNWNHGALCPWSDRQPDHEVTVDEVLASRMIAEPLTAMMACPADDGAACIIVASEEWVRRHHPDRRLVRPIASALRSEDYSPGHTFMGPVVGPATMTRATADIAYEAAGLGPDDMDVAMCHDAFANEELEYYELLGFCPDGEAERLVEEGATKLGGRIPFNTDGGLIARGHPAGPTGLAMVHEVVQQLRWEAGPRQVDGARHALAHLVGGGSICTVSLFEAE
ncbi:MAG TPA: thiolase family protein [Acidimicrobiales bacterium]|nr:thiolase family protein [Acidimicrobiales bacterium]